MTRHQRSAWIAAACIPVLFAASACSSGSKKSPGGQSAASGNGAGAHPTESAPPGDIPDNQAFVTYAAPDRAYSLQVPEGWAMTHDAAAVLFTDKYNSIRIEAHPAASQPTIDSVRATELAAVKAAAQGYLPGEVKMVQRSSGPAILVTYRADSAANSVTGKVAVEAVERYEFWRGGTEVVLTLAAPVGSDNVDPWRKVTDTFRWSA